jgi:Ohr subfamily peroxiredoxin
VGRSQKLDTSDAAVSASVGIGDNGQGGYGLAVELDVYLPRLGREVAEETMEKAHHVCPYSNATRGNVPVKLTLVD